MLWHGGALAAVLLAAAVDTAAATQPQHGIVHLAPPPRGAVGSHLADELRKLAALHRSGDLEDDEFRAAKRLLLAPTAAIALPFGQQVVSIRDHGAVGDNVHDDTDSIQAAIDTATNHSASVFIPSGIYSITRPLNVTAPVYGETASTSVIANHGDGTDAFLVMTGYHTEFRDFKVIGDCDPEGPCRTRDGIVLDINRSYMRFANVHAQFHGRHGLIQRASWATSWTNCKFWYNRGLGIFLDAIQGDPGVSNGVSFLGCESRWNGGPVITGGFVIDSPYFATREVTISGIYAEGNGCQALVGGTLYIGRSVTSVKILNSWLSASLSAPNSSVNYLLCNNGTAENAEVIEKDNFLLCPADTPGRVCKLYNGVSNTPSKQLTSTIVGDPGASGVPQEIDLLSVSDDAVFMVAGSVHLSRTGQATGFSGSYPFIASGDASGSRHVSVGESTIPSATHNMSLSFVRDKLRLSCPAYEFGFVVLNEQVDGHPGWYVFNSTVFPEAGMPRKTDDIEAPSEAPRLPSFYADLRTAAARR